MKTLPEMSEWLVCIACDRRFDIDEIRYTCECGGLLAVERDELPRDVATFDRRRSSHHTIDTSGVWRFREGVLSVPEEQIVTHPEGATRLYERDGLLFKHEGENPTGSFKDRGMTVAITQAVRVGASAVACASTGNTSASLAAYAAQAGLRAVVFVPSGKVAGGKLAQTLAYGATCLQIRGDFDAAMQLVLDASTRLGIYLVNSINPFRIEGQKTIIWELLQDLEWNAPDWIVVPAGNLGNTSAFGKALREAREAGWISRVPRLASIQAHRANPFYRSFRESFGSRHRVNAETIASAIRIGDPVSHERAVAAIRYTNGVVEEVTDDEIMAAKRAIDGMGIGCEPASAATLAGVRKLRTSGVMRENERVVCVLTGHLLKDAEAIMRAPAGRSIEIEPTIAAVEKALTK
ncbi:MAG TPA: threonine synthase [Thermoanaerobaculia bacterium]|nr:threonine synthase [Thermoanaerobaculia bacterium]